VADNQHVSIGYLRHLASIAPHPADRQHFALVADLIEAQHAEIERLRDAGDGLVAALKDARSAMCDYAHQGTGTDPESPEWEDFCMTTWEGVPNDLAAVDAAITAWKEARRG
jgi:hypothetical protein